MNDEIEVAGLAVLVQRLRADQHALLERVTQSLSAVVPSALRIQRRGLFNRGAVNRVEVLLGEQSFELADDRGQVTALIGHVVGGVVLQRQPVAIDAWIAGLRDALAQAANASEAVRAALARLT